MCMKCRPGRSSPGSMERMNSPKKFTRLIRVWPPACSSQPSGKNTWRSAKKPLQLVSTSGNPVAQAGGNKSKAAKSLGISRFALQRKLDKYGINGKPGDGSSA